MEGGGELEGWVNRNVSPLVVCVRNKTCPQLLSVSNGSFSFFLDSGMSFGESYVTNCFKNGTSDVSIGRERKREKQIKKKKRPSPLPPSNHPFLPQTR